jgi:DNA polymerase
MTTPSLDSARAAAARCTACPLYANATQTVFGEGPVDAPLMLVGEQPGDKEDLAGRPFVGPAGALLDRCLEAAGIDRGRAYVTNAVKHFKWTRQGKRRMHSKPSAREVDICKPWLMTEIELVKPKVLICLGATAAQSLLGRDFRVTRQRGEFLRSALADHVMTTVHPSSLLRATEGREQEIARFVGDLRKAAQALDQAAS